MIHRTNLRKLNEGEKHCGNRGEGRMNLSLDIRNFGAMTRHLRTEGTTATIISKVAFQHMATHQTVPVGTTLTLTQGPDETGHWVHGGVFKGHMEGSRVDIILLGKWLDFESAQLSYEIDPK